MCVCVADGALKRRVDEAQAWLKEHALYEVEGAVVQAPHCRIAKMYNSGVKRVEAAFLTTELRFIVKYVAKARGGRYLLGAALHGSPDDQIQKASEEMQGRGKNHAMKCRGRGR